MDTVKIEHGACRMIAHRGVSGLETENTNAAFVAAGSRSYFGVETDVHISADGKFIIFHDDNTLRVGQEDHLIEQTDSHVLREMLLCDRDGGEKVRCDLKIPFLCEYIRICRKYEKTCVLELKNAMTPTAIAGIVEEIRSLGWLEHVIFISFCFENLTEIRRLLPQQTVQFLTDAPVDADMTVRLQTAGMDLDIAYPSLTKEGLDAMHAAGVKVNCWTVDTAADALRLIDWGVDYITSNILE